MSYTSSPAMVCFVFRSFCNSTAQVFGGVNFVGNNNFDHDRRLHSPVSCPWNAQAMPDLTQRGQALKLQED